MKQIIGFLPSKPNENHFRTKNLTGDVVEITNNKVIVDFTILVKKKEEIMRVEYPLNECKNYFVSAEPKRINNLTFREFCRELEGLKIFKNNTEIPKWQLFWSGITTKNVFAKFEVKDRPANYDLN